MSYDFYVVEGKKLVDYKPTKEHYERAFARYCKNIANGCVADDDRNKILFLLVKMMGKRRVKGYNKDQVYAEFTLLRCVKEIVSEKTPRQFMQLFPVTKEYDGERYSTKDYFYCMEYINKIGIDEPIGEKASELLMEYCNRDIDLYIFTWMEVVSAMDVITTGRDHMLDWFEENGLHFQTYHQDGDYLVNDETGERHKIQKPKNSMRKLFSVVE